MNKSRKKYYVYQLLDPRTNEPFYIGKGCGDRMYRHERYVWKKNEWLVNPLKCQKIKDIVSCGYSIVYQREFWDTEAACLEEEKRLIVLYGKVIDGTGSLTNLTDGGEGQSGKVKWVYQYSLDGKYIGKHKSPLEASTSCKINVGSIQRAAAGKLKSAGGFMWSYQHVPTLDPYTTNLTRRVNQYTKAGELVRQYSSIRDASNATNIDPSNITSVCKGNTKSKTAGGYVWKYDGEPASVPTPHGLSRPVLQYTKRGDFIAEHASIKEATKISGANNIVHACMGKRKTSGGYVWRYK